MAIYLKTERNHLMTNTSELRPNDLCHCKVGRNTVLVTLISKDDSLKGGWLVRSTTTGKKMMIRDTSRLSLAATPETRPRRGIAGSTQR